MPAAKKRARPPTLALAAVVGVCAHRVLGHPRARRAPRPPRRSGRRRRPLRRGRPAGLASDPLERREPRRRRRRASAMRPREAHERPEQLRRMWEGVQSRVQRRDLRRRPAGALARSPARPRDRRRSRVLRTLERDDRRGALVPHRGAMHEPHRRTEEPRRRRAPARFDRHHAAHARLLGARPRSRQDPRSSRARPAPARPPRPSKKSPARWSTRSTSTSPAKTI
jgi:hypothetical protein